MKGKLYYERENEKKILKIIKGNSELQGFYAFLRKRDNSRPRRLADWMKKRTFAADYTDKQKTR